MTANLNSRDTVESVTEARALAEEALAHAEREIARWTEIRTDARKLALLAEHRLGLLADKAGPLRRNERVQIRRGVHLGRYGRVIEAQYVSALGSEGDRVGVQLEGFHLPFNFAASSVKRVAE